MNVAPQPALNLGRSSASIARSLRRQPHRSSAGLGWKTAEMFHWSVDADRHAYQMFDDLLLSYQMTDGVAVELAVSGRRMDYRMHSGLLVMVPGGASVTFDASRSFDCLNIHLSRGCFPGNGREWEEGPISRFRQIASDQQLSGLISVLAKEMRDPTEQGCLLADHLSAAIAYYLTYHLPGAAPAPQAVALSDGTLRRVVELMESRIEAGISLAELAAAAGLSQSQFARNFRKSMGRSPHAYLQHRRIEEAARLLATTRRDISDIALACGFSSQSHLTDAFRRARGLTPRQHRLARQ